MSAKLGWARSLGLLAAEAAWFGWTLAQPRPAPRADLLAVYGGWPDRYEAGWDLERRGDFAYLVFSDASPDCVAGMVRSHGPARRAELLLEPRARNTSQNARYVAGIIAAKGCRSVLVVTSWWHLPRALLLTRLALLGTGVRVEGSASDDPPGPVLLDRNLWYETLRLWGSLATFTSDARHPHFLEGPPRGAVGPCWPGPR